MQGRDGLFQRRVGGLSGFDDQQIFFRALPRALPHIDRTQAADDVDAGGVALFHQGIGDRAGGVGIWASGQYDVMAVIHGARRLAEKHEDAPLGRVRALSFAARPCTVAGMKIFRWLLLLFIVVPALEIYLLIKVGGLIGAWPTLLLLMLSAVLGIVLIRVQGFLAWRRASASLARGQLPALELLEGVFVLLGGILLLIPGFATDAVGLLCLIPAVRRLGVRWLLGRLVLTPVNKKPVSPAGEGPRTLEGDFSREEDRPPRP